MSDKPDQKHNAEPEQTAGERLFDFTTYFGIGWIANAAMGVAVYNLSEKEGNIIYDVRKKMVGGANDWVNDSYQKNTYYNGEYTDITSQLSGLETGNAQEFFYNAYKQGGGSFKSLADGLDGAYTASEIERARDMAVGRDRKLAVANTLANAGAISVGGFLAMVPVKIMEDHKLPITKTLDGWIDSAKDAVGLGFKSEFEKTRTLNARQERYDYIADAPEQSWGSVIGSRIASLIPFYATYAVMANKDNIVSGLQAVASGNKYANPNEGFKGTDHYINAAVDKGIEFAEDHNLPLINIPQDPEKLAKFKDSARMWGTDISYSLLVAESTYLFTRLLGPLMNGEKQPPQTQEANNIASFERQHQHESSPLDTVPEAKISARELQKDGAIQNDKAKGESQNYALA